MADITRLSRLLNGVNRGLDLTSNTLVVLSIKVGAGETELTQAILDNLVSLQDGSEVGGTLHTHDDIYFTETELGSNANGEGASLIGIEDASSQFTATDVEGALDEALDAAQAAQADADANTSDIADLRTTQGTADGDTDLGTFTGSIISDATTVKGALQELETEVELKADASVVTEIDANVDDLITLSGVAENSSDLGTFTGSTITDSSTIKTALQELETEVELKAADADVIKKDGSVAFTADQSMGGFKLTNLAAPTADSDAARKIDVDNATAGILSKESSRAATTAALPAVTYDNGTSGVGATLTADANGALPTIDGVTLVVSDRILVKNQAAALQNGIYVVSAVGDGSNPFVLTRAEDFDGSPAAEVQGGAATFVTEGSSQINTMFRMTGTGEATVGTDPINWVIYSRAEAITASTGLTKSGLDIQLADAAENASGIQVSSGAITLNNLDAFDTDDLTEGSNLYFTEARVRATVLTGADVSTNGAVSAADSVLSSIGKLYANQADLVTLSGVALGAVDLGTFTGSTITDNSTVKAALQELETEVELKAASADLASTANGEGASLIGIEDSGALFTATTVEAALAELKADLAAQNEADEITYDNSTSGLTATDVQAAIDEVEGRVDTLESQPTDAIREDLDAGEEFAAALRAVRIAKAADTDFVAGRIYYADKDASSADDFYVIGLVSPGVIVAAGNPVTVTKMGKMTATAHGFTVGQPIFLNAAGALTGTAPTADDEAIVRVGVARDANTIEVQIAVVGVN